MPPNCVLTCSECGHQNDATVEIEGHFLTTKEYQRLLADAEMVLLCDVCAKKRQ
jgi:hypothetical protein